MERIAIGTLYSVLYEISTVISIRMRDKMKKAEALQNRRGAGAGRGRGSLAQPLNI